jgi:O-antigen/teichoic acid export membrane protein
MKIHQRGLYLFISYFTSSLCNLLSLNIYSNILGKSIFGEYIYIQGIFLLVNLVLSATLTQVIYKFYNNYGNKLLSIITFFFLFLFLTSIIILSIYLFFSNDNLLKDNFFSIGIIFLLLVSIDIVNSYFQVTNNLQKLLYCEVLKSLAKLFIPLLFINLYDVTIDYFLIGFIVAHIIVFFIQILLIFLYDDKNQIINASIFNRVEMNDVFHYIFPVFLWSISIQFINYSDRFFISNIVNLSILGIYFANYTIFNFASQLITYPLINSVHPVLLRYNSNNEIERNELEKKLKILTSFFIIASVTIGYLSIIFYEEAIILLLNKTFIIDKITILIIVLTNIFWNIGSYGNKPYEVSNKTSYILYVLVFSLMLYIINSFLFLKIIGIKYAPIIKLFSFFVYILSLKFLAKRLNLVNWNVSISALKFFIHTTLLILLYIFLLEKITFNSLLYFLLKSFFAIILLIISYKNIDGFILNKFFLQIKILKNKFYIF